MSEIITCNFGKLKKGIKLNEEVLKSFEGVRDDEDVPLFLVLALTSAFGTDKEIIEMAKLTNALMNEFPVEKRTLDNSLVFFLAPLGSGNEKMRALVQRKLRGLVSGMHQFIQ